MASVHFVLCVKNDDYPASLERGKVYRTLPDKRAESVNHIRVIDESGEDYLFPEDYFIPIELPKSVQKELLENGV